MNFKKNIILLVFLFLGIISCTQKFKQCDFDFEDPYQNLYNEVLTELVEHRFYNFYLGEYFKIVNEKLYSVNPDTSEINKLKAKFQNQIFNDSTKFCDIYLDTLLSPNFYKWDDYSNDTSYYSREIQNLLKDYTGEEQAVLDNLNSVQNNFESNDFQLCTSKVKSIIDFAGFENYKGGCLIGKVVFSKVYFNSNKDKALLYYDLKCGGDMCGMGEITEIKKIDGRWKITKFFMRWVS